MGGAKTLGPFLFSVSQGVSGSKVRLRKVAILDPPEGGGSNQSAGSQPAGPEPAQILSGPNNIEGSARQCIFLKAFWFGTKGANFVFFLKPPSLTFSTSKKGRGAVWSVWLDRILLKVFMVL